MPGERVTASGREQPLMTLSLTVRYWEKQTLRIATFENSLASGW
jgi:hypothetical protein